MTRTRTLATLIAATAAAGIVAVPSAEARRIIKPVSCKVASLDSATAKQNVTITATRITAEDDWETVSALCNNENVTGSIKAKATFNLAGRRVTQKAAARKTAPASGRITGPVVLNYSFGATQTGSFRTTASGTYSCSSSTSCSFNGQLSHLGKLVGAFTGTFDLGDTATHEYRVTFEDVIISS